MLGPSGPRRLRLAVEHLAQYRGGICFCIDLDPRWVIKLIKKGWMEHLEGVQGALHRSGDHDPAAPATTSSACSPRRSCSKRWPCALEAKGTSIRKAGITGIFSGGTEFTPQWTRFAHEELLGGVYMTPTYGNTLMGLAAERAERPAEELQDHLLRAAAAGRGRGRRFRRSRQGRRLRRDRAA